ncbi:hypothetical protein MHH70_18300 [Metasolibacillus sp. FSL H7-0170]|uniref:hypothetical protein n=1 Tax=Metasolibacillus sp. FSL H7-0170 TaxID=2921431 RepID=UPI003157F2B3
MSELKTVIVSDNVIINVGDWDYQEHEVVINQNEIDAAEEHNASVDEENYVEVPEPILETVQQNPLPEGATVEERDMFFTDEYGWREVGWEPPMTAAEKTAHLEQENRMLKLQNQANTERMEFVEELIAEIAMKVYE